MWGTALTDALDTRVADLLLAALERLQAHRPNALRILMYHRVLDAARFAAQVDFLARNHPVIALADLLAAYDAGAVLPAGAVLLTFDDAYRDFADCAWPVLRRRGLPATLFVATAYPDHPERVYWWDRLEHALRTTPRRDELDTALGRFPLGTASQRGRALRVLRAYAKTLDGGEITGWVDGITAGLAAPPIAGQVLGWDALRELARAGVTLGAHTRTHPHLDRVPAEEAEAEAVGSLHDLEREIGPVPPVFAYPDGRFTPGVVARLARAGFALGFTTVKGTNVLPAADRMALRRINVGPHATAQVLRAKLLDATVQLNRWRPLIGKSRPRAGPVHAEATPQGSAPRP